MEDKGAKVYLSQTADNITDDIDLVVYTAAINFDTNEEYKEAVRRNIPVMKRATLLGQIAERSALCGCHSHLHDQPQFQQQ